MSSLIKNNELIKLLSTQHIPILHSLSQSSHQFIDEIKKTIKQFMTIKLNLTHQQFNTLDNKEKNQFHRYLKRNQCYQ